MQVSVRFDGDMRFVGSGPSGHELRLDSAPETGGTGQGARPMEMLLVALGGCTGMNVVSILRKMRVPFHGLEIRLEGERQAEHPKAYTAIRIDYDFRGEGLLENLSKLERAVNLSHERYCSVAASLDKNIAVRHRILLNGSAP